MKSHWIISGTSPEGFTWNGENPVHPDTGTLVEAVIGEPNFKALWWLNEALKASKPVARVKLPGGAATGFLIGTDVFMTNNHVFEDKTDAANAVLQFNYQLRTDGSPAGRDEWKCDPEDMFKTNPSLDYSIVRVQKKNGKNAGDVWGCLNLRHGTSVVQNQRVNIIQHPQGRFKEIAFRDNQIKVVDDQYIQYLTDTDYGTSGSPVFDDWFNVVALHNQRVRDPNNPYRYHRNQGYRIDTILSDAGDLIP